MKIRTLGLIVTLALGLLAAPLSTDAQQAGKMYQIGILFPGTEEAHAPGIKIIVDSLNQYGWVEGQNILIEYRYAGQDYARFPALAAELVQHKVDLIVTSSTSGTRAVMQATKTIPIVFTMTGDPVGRGLVASLARPGGRCRGRGEGCRVVPPPLFSGNALSASGCLNP